MSHTSVQAIGLLSNLGASPSRRRVRRGGVLSMLLVAAFGLWLAPADCIALTFVVRNNNDSGAGSLRQAINDNNLLGGSTIIFSNIVTGRITLLSGELAISTNLTIVGPGASVLTVSGNTNSRVCNITQTNAVVTISGLTLADGVRPSGLGGCILNVGTLTLDTCVVSNNSTFSVFGAAIYNDRLLTISNTIVCSNRTTGGSGGGLYHHGGTATIVNSTFYGNVGYQGGALNLQGGTSAALTNCTIYGNTADAGGGIYNVSQLVVRNCTIVSNTAAAFYPGSYGGGIYTFSTPDISSTIIAANSTSTNTGYDCYGTFTSGGYNLVGRSNGSFGWTSLGDQVGSAGGPLNPLLGPAQQNGGPTPTLAPLPGSPAIDQGKTILATDQRGRARPAQFASIDDATLGDGSDIGAVEVWPESPLLTIRPAGANVVLAWPIAAVDFRLESLTNLPASNNWFAVSNAPAAVNGQFTVTNSTTPGRRFYRLIFP